MGKEIKNREEVGWFEGRGWNSPLAVVAEALWDHGTAQMWVPRGGMSMVKDASGRDVHGKGISMGRNAL